MLSRLQTNAEASTSTMDFEDPTLDGPEARHFIRSRYESHDSLLVMQIMNSRKATYAPQRYGTSST